MNLPPLPALPFADARSLVRSAIANALRPDQPLSLVEWSDRYRYLSSELAAEKGRYESRRVPYVRAIMECLSVESPVQEVTVMKGAQLGMTEVGNNWVGYIMDHCPGPIMMVLPRELDCRRSSRQRIDPMIRTSPRLREIVAESKSRDRSNTTLLKEFPGGILALVGANASSNLRSMPVRDLFLDEVDAYPEDSEGAGDPMALAKRGTRTFASSKKIFAVSTPRDEGTSRIAKAYEESDQSEYKIPCPHCRHMQVIDWKRISWKDDDPETAALACEKCGVLIEEHHKTWMLERGEWVARVPERSEFHRGFKISALYSPIGWYSWRDAVQDFLRARHNPNELRVFVNETLGETWKQKGEAPDWEKLWLRRESYARGTVPKGGLLLTAGVDVQKDRIEVEVVAWGRELESWSVWYDVLPGDPTVADTWQQLDQVLDRAYRHEGGVDLRIRMMAVDSGFETQHVYAWVRGKPVNRVLAVKGRDSKDVLVGTPSAVEVSSGGRRLQRGVKVWPIGVELAKSELYGWLKMATPVEEGAEFPPGYCHFPSYDPEWFKQLTAEQVVIRQVRGRRRAVWEKTRERNEALDCRIYARAAAAVAGADRYMPEHWDKLEEALGLRKPAEEPRRQSGGQPGPSAGGDDWIGRREGWMDRWQ